MLPIDPFGIDITFFSNTVPIDVKMRSISVITAAFNFLSISMKSFPIQIFWFQGKYVSRITLKKSKKIENFKN